LTESTRQCACGCGIPLEGPSQQRFASDACRKRAARRRAKGNGQHPDTIVDALPVREPGRVRAGLETWIAKRAVIAELPEVTVEAARVLADELDADPDASPLWGRYTALIETLTTPQLEAQEFNAEVRAIFEEFASIRIAEEWRAAQAAKARAEGKDASRWGHLCPVGCVQGRHDWHQWGGPESPKSCLDCHGRLEHDGTMFWDDWVAPKAWEHP
jgi:hypothetical protein